MLRYAKDPIGQFWTVIEVDGRFCVHVGGMNGTQLVQLPFRPAWYPSRHLSEHALRKYAEVRKWKIMEEVPNASA